MIRDIRSNVRGAAPDHDARCIDLSPCATRRSACKPLIFGDLRCRLLTPFARQKPTLLGYKPSGLSYIVYTIPKTAKYTTFEVKKKGGGERRIDAPVPMLKGLQKRLADVLYECARELEESEKRKNTLSHAFRKKYSIITKAKTHIARRYVLTLDLQNFFRVYTSAVCADSLSRTMHSSWLSR